MVLKFYIKQYDLTQYNFWEDYIIHLICSEVRIEGLETLDYLDNLMNRERYTEQADAITFDGEVLYQSLFSSVLRLSL